MKLSIAQKRVRRYTSDLSLHYCRLVRVLRNHQGTRDDACKVRIAGSALAEALARLVEAEEQLAKEEQQ